MPPPTPVDTTMAMKSSTPQAAPNCPSPNANALVSMSTNAGNPVTSATRAASGKSTHGGALTGDTHDRSRVSGPADPTPHTISSPTAIDRSSSTIAGHGSPVAPVGT